MTPLILPGDAALVLTTLPPESIDLVVTSPPYDNLRTYGDPASTFDFEAIARELTRVLKPGGVICWVVGDQVLNGSETTTSAKQKIFFHDVCGLRVHDTMIYQKRNFSHPERSRYHQVFEYIFVLSKGAPKTFNPLKDRRNLTAGAVGNLGVNTFTERDGTKSTRPKKVTAQFGMRHNVWLGNTRGQEDMCERLRHPAMMPRWLAHDLIQSWSNKGDTVLDPFAGSGTTGQQAAALERHSILIERNVEYLTLLNNL